MGFSRILEWVAISFSRRSSPPGDRTPVFYIVSRCFYRLSHQGNLHIIFFFSWLLLVSSLCLWCPVEMFKSALVWISLYLFSLRFVMLPKGFPGGSVVKNLPTNAGDVGLIPESGRSPGEENGNPLQYFCWRILWTEEPGLFQIMIWWGFICKISKRPKFKGAFLPWEDFHLHLSLLQNRITQKTPFLDLVS